MELIEWRDAYATGISGVDYEHKELIALINSLYSKQTKHANKDELINILNEIYAAIHRHFMLEEKLMKRHAYDEYKQHSEDHMRLLDDIREFTTEYETMPDYDELQLKKKLNDWFSIHFSTHDARLHRLEQLIARQEEDSGGFFSVLKKLQARYLGRK